VEVIDSLVSLDFDAVLVSVQKTQASGRDRAGCQPQQLRDTPFSGPDPRYFQTAYA
jgi:hypothetical protein